MELFCGAALIHSDSISSFESVEPVLLLAKPLRKAPGCIHPFLSRLIAISNAAGGAVGAQWSGRNRFAERSECFSRNRFGPLGLYPWPCVKTATGHTDKAMRVENE